MSSGPGPARFLADRRNQVQDPFPVPQPILSILLNQAFIEHGRDTSFGGAVTEVNLCARLFPGF